MNTVEISKFLSYVLRHAPESIGLELDEHGWAAIDRLLELAAASGNVFSRAELEEVVATSDKKRFVIDGERIRANQGHSIAVDVELAEVEPPPVLYHGTATRFMEAISAGGLQKMQRQHVHLSKDADTAHKVGIRHGKPVILEIDTAAMRRAGHKFYLSQNGVYLTDKVPPQYITKRETE